MPRHRDPFDKLPHRPSDYGAATPRGNADNLTAENLKSETGDGAAPNNATAVPTPLETFRASNRRPPLHKTERLLLWVVGAHLVFLPWAIGTMRPWGQFTSLALSVISLFVALLPREYLDHQAGVSYKAYSYAKLFRFPIFWLGLALLGLITIQGINPSYQYERNAVSWWMVAIPHITWLPSGVRVPFERWGPWRMLLIYSSAFLTVCALWVGLTRRRTIQALATVIAVNAVLLSLLGLAQRILGATKIFWSYESSNPSFFASFVYKNHAGAYLDLALAVTCGLGAWFYMRGQRRMEKSNPSGLVAFLATCIAVSVLISYARGATLVMIAYLTLVVGAFVYQQFRLPKHARQPVVAIALLCIFGFFLKTGLEALHSDLAWDRLRQAVSGEDASVQARAALDRASLDMLKDTWLAGVGADGWPFRFPTYAQHYPELWGPHGPSVFWNQAHNDILELPIELGVPGVVLILASFAFWFVALFRSYAWQNPFSASVILGCLFLVGMSWGDFVFYNPAVLITWCALWPLATVWARLEERAR